ncbi:hypothetical protein TNCV_2646321 [Trichonephila clavipes]|nr:hypothetical protein TNCV_2646321 [Trichonephila clavipes]
MFLAGHPSQGCFGLQSHCAPTAVLHKELESIDSSVLYLVLRLAWCCDLVFDGGRGFRNRIQWSGRWLAWRSESTNEMDDGSEHEFRLRLTDFRKRNQW